MSTLTNRKQVITIAAGLLGRSVISSMFKDLRADHNLDENGNIHSARYNRMEEYACSAMGEINEVKDSMFVEQQTGTYRPRSILVMEESSAVLSKMETMNASEIITPVDDLRSCRSFVKCLDTLYRDDHLNKLSEALRNQLECADGLSHIQVVGNLDCSSSCALADAAIECVGRRIDCHYVGIYDPITPKTSSNAYDRALLLSKLDSVNNLITLVDFSADPWHGHEKSNATQTIGSAMALLSSMFRFDWGYTAPFVEMAMHATESFGLRSYQHLVCKSGEVSMPTSPIDKTNAHGSHQSYTDNHRSHITYGIVGAFSGDKKSVGGYLNEYIPSECRAHVIVRNRNASAQKFVYLENHSGLAHTFESFADSALRAAKSKRMFGKYGVDDDVLQQIHQSIKYAQLVSTSYSSDTVSSPRHKNWQITTVADHHPNISSQRVVVVLDLDETIIHARTDATDNADFHVFSKKARYGVFIRPFLNRLLDTVEHLDAFLVIYTMASHAYAQTIVSNALQSRTSMVRLLWSRRHCRTKRPYKSLSRLADVLGVDTRQMIVFDDRPNNYSPQFIENGTVVPVTPFGGRGYSVSKQDKNILGMCKYIEAKSAFLDSN